MKHWSSRYDINRPRPRHGHIFSKYKKCLGMITLMCINQNLSNILKLNSWKSEATLRLSWKKLLIIKNKAWLRSSRNSDTWICTFEKSIFVLIPITHGHL